MTVSAMRVTGGSPVIPEGQSSTPNLESGNEESARGVPSQNGAMVEQTHHDPMIQRVLFGLPTVAGGTPEEDARSVLRLLFQPIADRMLTPLPQIESDANLCPNCGAAVASTRSPYCGGVCRDTAAFVRQIRTSLAEGTLVDEERQAAFGQLFWYQLGGGRPYRQQLVDDKGLKRVFKNYDGRCADCGAPATTIDHIGTG
jgi:hypothetical protein